MFGWFDQGWYAFSYRVLSGLFNHFIPSKLISQISADFPPRSAQKMQNSLQILSGSAYGTKSYWIFCEVWTLSTSWHSLSPTKHFIQAAWIFPLCPSGSPRLWSPRKPRSNIPAMLTAYTHSRTTHVSVYSTMQTIGWGLQKWLSVCEQVSERFGFIVETRGLTCCKMVACVSKHVFFFTVLSMFTGFVSKSRKNSLFLWCVACWTQQKYNDNTV